MNYFTVVSFAVFTMVSAAGAALRLPAVFSDGMVLQRGRPVPVWGWADAGKQVTVRFAGQERTAKAGADGRWSVRLDELSTSAKPGTLAVACGGEKAAVENVLVGEVWLCAGQSNMAMTVGRALDYEKEKVVADLPLIRMFTTARQSSPEPREHCAGQWQVCSPDTVGRFSATAYFFGRKIHRELDVPVGLVNSSWGGTAVEAWTSTAAQEDLPELKELRASWKQKTEQYDPDRAQAAHEKRLERWRKAAKAAKAAGKRPPRRPRKPADPRRNQNRPANLFNGMIHPLIPFALRGAIWYQGERNAHGERAKTYGLQLATMIEDWRKRWGYDFPFLWVQLPNFQKPQTEPVETGGWVVVQEQMLKTLAVPKTGMAITIDVGDAKDIHPKNKQAVGRRLARWALAECYGKDMVSSGPLYTAMEKKGSSIVLRFDHVGGGLIAKGETLKGFAIAGRDKQWHWADARIDGATVVVGCPAVKQPAAVRYSWASNPVGNLFNEEGLPASPFRTDDRPLDTEGKR